MKKQQQEEREPQIAELSDEELNNLANYEAGDNSVIDPDPSKYYFLAADDPRDPGRPEGVQRCLQMGYKISEKAHNGSPDCKLVEIDLRIWNARQEKMRRLNAKKLRATMSPGKGDNDGLEVLSGHKHGVGTVKR